MRKTTSITFTVVMILSVVSYLLADRYLIQHVEIADVSAYAAATSESVVSTSAAAVSAQTGETASQSQIAQADEEAAQSALSAGGWDYQGEGVTISVSEYTTGSGSDTLTYFVADVVLANAEALRSAFANDQFGRNITADTSEIAEDNEAIFAINGDYYGFRTDGIIIRNGVIYRDVPARMGLAFYADGSMEVYDETQTSAEALLAQGVWNTLSFGPALVVDSVAVTDFDSVAIDRNFGNRSIQNSNPRTGIGMIDENHFVFVVVDGRSPGYSRGVTLEEFAQIFQSLGCAQAYNIDGGGSSTMYFMGAVVNNPLGRGSERGTSDILYIGA